MPQRASRGADADANFQRLLFMRNVCFAFVVAGLGLFTGVTVMLWTSLDVAREIPSAQRHRNVMELRAAALRGGRGVAGGPDSRLLPLPSPPLPPSVDAAVANAPAARRDALPHAAAPDPPGLHGAAASPTLTMPPAPRVGDTTIRACGSAVVTDFVWAPGEDLQGGDLQALPVAAADPRRCCDACAVAEGCIAWTFVKASSACWLKREVEHVPEAHLSSVLAPRAAGGTTPATDVRAAQSEAAALAAAARAVEAEYSGSGPASSGAQFVSAVCLDVYTTMFTAERKLRSSHASVVASADDAAWSLPPGMSNAGIVVIAHNRPEYLSQALRSLFALVGIRLFQVFVSLDDPRSVFFYVPLHFTRILLTV